MRWLPKAVPVLIAIIALDLAMVFGFEAFRILSSPMYGLDQRAFSKLVYGIAWLFGAGPRGLFNLAAFFGAVYLTISAVFTLHLANRIGALRGMRLSHDLLDAGMILVVVATLVAATPAIMQGASEVMIQGRLPLWLVGLAATLSMIERLPETDTRRPGPAERWWSRFAARRSGRNAHVVSPAIRDRAMPQRWNDLRGEAGMTIEPVPISRPVGPWFTLRQR
jgi:hypothetical protein